MENITETNESGNYSATYSPEDNKLRLYSVTREDGAMWIHFTGKPSRATLNRVKLAGGTYDRKRVAWYFTRAVNLSEIGLAPVVDLAAEMAALDETPEETARVDYCSACKLPVTLGEKEFRHADGSPVCLNHNGVPLVISEKELPRGFFSLRCDRCRRGFSDTTAEGVSMLLDVHHFIAHRDDEPEPTGTDGDAAETVRESAEENTEGASAPSASIIAAFRQWCDGEAYIDNAGNYRTRKDGEPRRVAPWNKEAKRTFKDVAEFARAAREMFPREPEKPREIHMAAPRAEVRPEKPVQAEQAQSTGTLTVTRDTLRALKLINDAAILEEKRKAAEEDAKYDYSVSRSGIFSEVLARVTLGDTEAVINVARLDKWAATFEASARFTVKLTPEGLTIQNSTSFFRLVAGGVPFNFARIELIVSESGEAIAPALPDAEEMKRARKELADGRRTLKAERTRQNMLRGVNSARADVVRAEEYAAKLKREVRETIQRAEELTEAECDEAVMLARRVRDLRRLRREVERAAEDPQINTPEFFEWVTEEHKSLYAEAFAAYDAARERERKYKPTKPWSGTATSTRERNRKKTAKAKAEVAKVLNAAFNQFIKSACDELFPEEERDGWQSFFQVFNHKFDTELQTIKRTLRQFPREVEAARQRIAELRETYREALEAYAPHVRETERERYERALNQFQTAPRELAEAA